MDTKFENAEKSQVIDCKSGDEKKRYILIVDDEVNIIRSLVRELTDWARGKNIQISAAVIGKEALQFLQDHRDQVELVIADMRMPGMSGGDMLLEIKEQFPEIMTILLTAYNDRAEIAKAVKADIFSFIPKPWDADHLIDEIEKALEQKRNRRG
jgi:DNA-binding NtrC family response regulator